MNYKQNFVSNLNIGWDYAINKLNEEINKDTFNKDLKNRLLPMITLYNESYSYIRNGDPDMGLCGEIRKFAINHITDYLSDIFDCLFDFDVLDKSTFSYEEIVASGEIAIWASEDEVELDWEDIIVIGATIAKIWNGKGDCILKKYPQLSCHYNYISSYANSVADEIVKLFKSFSK